MSGRASTLVLILANLIPLLGVVQWEWDVLSVLLLYWAENVVIGVMNVVRMTTCAGGNLLQGVMQLANRPVPEEVVENLPRISINAMKVFLIPFFLVHYGALCFGHLTFIIAIFSDGGLSKGSTSALAELWQGTFWIAVAAVFASHLFSFFANYIGKGEYRNASLFLLMHRPYGRIISMHVAIVLGAGLVMYLGSPLPILVILILVKTFLDVRLHEKERSKLGASIASAA
jgi:hypothetical protein